MSGWKKTESDCWQRALGDRWCIQCRKILGEWDVEVWEQDDPDWTVAGWTRPVLEEALAEVAAELVKTHGYHDLAARVMRMRGPQGAQSLPKDLR